MAVVMMASRQVRRVTTLPWTRGRINSLRESPCSAWVLGALAVGVLLSDLQAISRPRTSSQTDRRRHGASQSGSWHTATEGPRRSRYWPCTAVPGDGATLGQGLDRSTPPCSSCSRSDIEPPRPQRLRGLRVKCYRCGAAIQSCPHPLERERARLVDGAHSQVADAASSAFGATVVPAGY